MSGTLKLNDTLFATENNGVISVTSHSTETNVIQNSNVITQSLTIANNKNATKQTSNQPNNQSKNQ